jgi:hypothetical protein
MSLHGHHSMPTVAGTRQTVDSKCLSGMAALKTQAEILTSIGVHLTRHEAMREMIVHLHYEANMDVVRKETTFPGIPQIGAHQDLRAATVATTQDTTMREDHPTLAMNATGSPSLAQVSDLRLLCLLHLLHRQQ